MLHFWKEYGVIVVLTAVALTGYFLIGDRRGELMEQALDVLGTRLVELAAQEDDRDDIARQFALFQEKVERDEISPDMVETVAANVLNLRVRGAVITPEEAELMLFSEPADRLPSPTDPVGKPVYSTGSPPDKPSSLNDLDERLKVMFQLADAVQVQGDSASYLLHFAQDQHGVHLVLDPAMASKLESGQIKTFYQDLERKEWVKWQDNLAKDQARSEARMKEQAARLARAETAIAGVPTAPEVRTLERWASAQKLALLGATASLDTTLINQEISLLLSQLGVALDSLAHPSIQVVIKQNAAQSARSGN